MKEQVQFEEIDEAYVNQEEMQEQQQPLGSDESDDDASSEKIRSATIINKSKWDKYNLDEYGEDQDEIEKSVQGSNGNPVRVYLFIYF